MCKYRRRFNPEFLSPGKTREPDAFPERGLGAGGFSRDEEAPPGMLEWPSGSKGAKIFPGSCRIGMGIRSFSVGAFPTWCCPTERILGIPVPLPQFPGVPSLPLTSPAPKIHKSCGREVDPWRWAPAQPIPDPGCGSGTARAKAAQIPGIRAGRVLAPRDSP